MNTGLVLEIAEGPARDSEGSGSRLARAWGWQSSTACSLNAVVQETTRTVSASVVVILPDRAVPARELIDLSRQIASLSPPPAVGFVRATAAAGTPSIVERLSSRQPNCRSPSTQRFLGHPHFQGSIRGARIASVDGALSERDALTAPTGVLYLAGHSNGQDMGLSETVLCQRDDVPPAEAPRRALSCFNGAPCRFEGALARVSFSRIDAEIVVNVACWGMSASDWPYSRSVTIGEALLANARVRSVVTLMRAASLDDDDFRLLYFLINAGLPAGAVVAAVNQARLRRGRPADMVCFGDPTAGIEATCEEVVAQQISPTRFVFPVSRQSMDVSVRLPGSAEGAVVVGEHPEFEWGTRDGSGRLFLTSCADDTEVTHECEIVPRATLSGIVDFVSEMAVGAALLRRFALVVATQAPPAMSTAVVPLFESHASLAGALESWPIQRLLVRSVLRKITYEEPLAQLDRALDVVGEHLGRFYAECAGFGTMAFVRLMAACAPVELRGSQHDCPYCGAAVEELARRTLDGGSVRRLWLCDDCGPVYEGDGACARAMAIDAGSPRVMVPVTNPFSSSVPARVVVTLSGCVGAAAVVTSAAVRVPPGSTRHIEVACVPPPGAVPGIAYVECMAVLGTQVTFLRAPFELQPPLLSIVR